MQFTSNVLTISMYTFDSLIERVDLGESGSGLQ